MLEWLSSQYQVYQTGAEKVGMAKEQYQVYQAGAENVGMAKQQT